MHETYSLRERLADLVERVWWCEVRRRHRVKMQSHGHCVRCGRLVGYPWDRSA